ncbi:unnamed protein product [Trypanosoma congolense IL3000]|uniref:WGS project CAEQ00000000 data, annotated contig 1992 n=1 Tax=Trypanosoma congolense (strain IL3000) TaxID=1068625 RepID=F9WAM8_TRYCI|nr:unnamed protein product [Trypanosoma congolense IL3000]
MSWITLIRVHFLCRGGHHEEHFLPGLESNAGLQVFGIGGAADEGGKGEAGRCCVPLVSFPRTLCGTSSNNSNGCLTTQPCGARMLNTPRYGMVVRIYALNVIQAPFMILEKFTHGEKGKVLLDLPVERVNKIKKVNVIVVLYTPKKSLTELILHRQHGGSFQGNPLFSMRCMGPPKPKLVSLS